MKNLLLYIFIFIPLLSIGQLPYVVSYSEISEEVKELWHDQSTGKSYAITVERLCKIDASDIKCQSFELGQQIMPQNQTLDRFNETPLLIGNYGEFYSLSENGIKAHPLEQKFPNAAVYKDGEDLWVAGYSIYKFNNGKVDTIPVIVNSEIPYWDIRSQDENYIWFLNHGVGLYRIKKINNELRRVSNLNGLPTNNLTCMHINYEGEVFVGYKGGIAKIKNVSDIELFKLKKYIGRETIKELESDSQGNIWFLTDKKLGILNPKDGEVKIIPTKSDPEFVINTLEYNPQKDLMLIGSTQGLFLASRQGAFYNGDKLFSQGKLYYFGKELLISDGKKVKSYNPETNSFDHSEFRPINQALKSSDGMYWVFDKKHAIQLSNRTQEVMQKIRVPYKKVHHIVSLDDYQYFCHESGIAKFKNGKFTDIVNDDEAFFNVIICNDVLYALSEKGIYKIDGSELNHESILDEGVQLLRSNKQFLLGENSILIPSKMGIVRVICTDTGVEFKNYPSLDTIYDFHIHKDEIYILFGDRLALFKKDDYLDDPYHSFCVIPANADERSMLFVDNQDKIWIRNEQGLAYISTDHSKICNILPPRPDLKEKEKSKEEIPVSNESRSWFSDWKNCLIAIFIVSLMIVLLRLITRRA